MQIQPQLMLLQKTLLNIEGLGRELYPDLDIWSTASPILREWMRERTSLRRAGAEHPCARRSRRSSTAARALPLLLAAPVRAATAPAGPTRRSNSRELRAGAARAGPPPRYPGTLGAALLSAASFWLAVSGASTALARLGAGRGGRPDPLRSPRRELRVQRSLTEGSIAGGLFRFALPILFANMLQSLNGSVNSVWVGRYLGEAALTATSNANMVMFLLIGAAFGVALAATILVGQSIGANNMAETKRMVGTSATFFTGISVAMACRAYPVPAAAHRHEHTAALARARGGLHARDLPRAAVSLPVRLRRRDAARRRGLEDAVLFHAAVGRRSTSRSIPYSSSASARFRA